MIAHIHWLAACIVLGAGSGAVVAASAPATEAVVRGDDDTSDSLGLALTDPVVRDAMNLFNLEKVDEAVDLIDRTVKERVQGDPERNRELRLLGGILVARSDRKLTDAYTRLRAAEGVNDSRSTSAKAEAARDAVKWAVKNGAKGDRPDLKKTEDWLRALDGAREDYVKDLNVRYEKLSRAVREREFAGLEALVKADKEIVDRVLVIRYLPEKGADVRSGFVDKLKLTVDGVKSERRVIHGEIEACRRDKNKLPPDSGKRRQIDEKIALKERQIREADTAVEMLNRTIQSIKA